MAVKLCTPKVIGVVEANSTNPLVISVAVNVITPICTTPSNTATVFPATAAVPSVATTFRATLTNGVVSVVVGAVVVIDTGATGATSSRYWLCTFEMPVMLLAESIACKTPATSDELTPVPTRDAFCTFISVRLTLSVLVELTMIAAKLAVTRLAAKLLPPDPIVVRAAICVAAF